MRKIVAGELPDICFDSDTIEAGQRAIQVAYRFVLKDICVNNKIEIKDVVIVYIRIPGEANIIEVGEKSVQRDYRISIKNLLKNPVLKDKIKVGAVVNVYLKKKPKPEESNVIEVGEKKLPNVKIPRKALKQVPEVKESEDEDITHPII